MRKRLVTPERSRSFVDWQQRKALVTDLEKQRRAIVEEVAREESAAALDLMRRFLGLTSSTLDRRDGNGAVIGVFQGACEDLADLAQAVGADPDQLTERDFEALTANDYGQVDDLIPILAPQLGGKGLERLNCKRRARCEGRPSV